MPKGESTTLTIDGHEVTISNPDKVMFPKRGETKLDTVEHYLRVAEPLMRTMGGRPVLMQRFPNGVKGKSFFQKRVPETRPDWLQTAVVSTPNGTTSDAMIAADLAHVAWAVNLGCLDNASHPARLLFHPVHPFLLPRLESALDWGNVTDICGEGVTLSGN